MDGWKNAFLEAYGVQFEDIESGIQGNCVLSSTEEQSIEIFRHPKNKEMIIKHSDTIFNLYLGITKPKTPSSKEDWKVFLSSYVEIDSLTVGLFD